MIHLNSLELSTLNAEELQRDAAWWSIYDDAFAHEEREPHEVLLNGLFKGASLAHLSRIHGRTVGISVTHQLRKPPAVFLVYLAVSPEARSRGIGSQLLEYSWAAGRDRLAAAGADALGLVWEIGTPAGPGSTREHERRMEFYFRIGGKTAPVPYAQPPLHGGSPVSMLLCWRPANDSVVPPDFRAIRAAVYREKYAGVNGIPLSQLERLEDELDSTNAG